MWLTAFRPASKACARVAPDRREALLSCNVASLSGPPGSRRIAFVTVGNPTSDAWPADRFRIGVRLRDEEGRLVRELPGLDMPDGATAPGGADTVVVDVRLPDAGRLELLVDVVEEGVCWFSDRGSNAVVLPLRASADAPEPYPSGRIVDLAFARLAGARAEPADRRMWIARLDEGARVEDLVSAFRARAGTGWPERRRAFQSGLRTLLERASSRETIEFAYLSRY